MPHRYRCDSESSSDLVRTTLTSHRRHSNPMGIHGALFDFSNYRQLKTHRIVSLRALDIQAFTIFFLSFTFYCVTLFQDGT